MKPLVAIVLVLAVVPPVAANAAHEDLMKMSPSLRNAALSTFMQANGEPDCTVTETFFQGGYNGGSTGDVFWNVRCANKKAYSVLVKDNPQGSTRILDCDELKAVTKGSVECFKKLPKK